MISVGGGLLGDGMVKDWGRTEVDDLEIELVFAVAFLFPIFTIHQGNAPREYRKSTGTYKAIFTEVS